MTDENKRTETARDHDDSRIIDAAQKDALGAGAEQSRAGGEKQTAVGTRAATTALRSSTCLVVR